jgi:hypothetical protein
LTPLRDSGRRQPLRFLYPLTGIEAVLRGYPQEKVLNADSCAARLFVNRRIDDGGFFLNSTHINDWIVDMRLWLLLICTTIYAGCEQAAETAPQNLQSETRSDSESPAAKTPKVVPQSGLAGEWKIFHGKDDEHEHSVTLEKVDETHYRLGPKSLAFGGLYEYDGTLLKMVDENPGYSDLTWQMTESNALVMIEGDYIGAVMGQNDFIPSM